ncbi:DUF3108 domain-containing protein [Rhodanobacter glycinis]|uniref:DUF3108 domain-containing protein n=1 Tax=Rhodanobacter glycinis TaxID=582702 RepID=A0A1I4FRV4_9GAMM|nr:DUF3108 domain-containing protein [Rhodanobacter glycinis]SFL19727.1 Protein of unknown function [Rhodanobacter glycinis]
MSTFSPSRTFVAGLVLALATSAAFAATPPQPFTATYQVLRDGEAIGQATIQLKAVGDGQYEYSNDVKGTSGLAAMLGASSSETTRFRWTGGVPETLTYDYKMETAIKQKQRHLQADWSTHQVSVTDNGKHFSYATAPGMVDRNTLPLALGLALQDNKRSVTLPVGVKQQIESQQFQVKGKETVKVPAGNFQAERVERTDSDKSFDAWYAPRKYPVPVKLAQSDGGNLTLQLIGYHQP